jgi:hypothetical protein
MDSVSAALHDAAGVVPPGWHPRIGTATISRSRRIFAEEAFVLENRFFVFQKAFVVSSHLGFSA